MSGALPQDARPAAWALCDQLAEAACAAETEQALLFVMANESYALAPYRSALVFTIAQGEAQLRCASGLTAVDRRSAFGSWAEQLVATILPQLQSAQSLAPSQVPEALRGAWAEYWPDQVQVHPVVGMGQQLLAVVVYVFDRTIDPAEVAMLNTLHRTHGVCLQRLRDIHGRFGGLRRLLNGGNRKARRVFLLLSALAIVAMCIPIRQFVISPAEIISLDAVAVTSPVEGVVAELVAKPNQAVKKGDILVRLDDTAIRNRLEAARQGLGVSRAEYLASAHRAFVSTERTSEAGVLKGRINERLAEVAFLQEQLAMLEIRAARDGIAVYGQENDWIGKPVSAGQRIMELADSTQVGVQVWVPVADAINLQEGQPISVLLHARPLDPLNATILQAGYQATRSPDGVAAYRVRAALTDGQSVRLGLRGNAKISGEWVMMGYLVFRRPLTAVRQWLGL